MTESPYDPQSDNEMADHADNHTGYQADDVPVTGGPSVNDPSQDASSTENPWQEETAPPGEPEASMLVPDFPLRRGMTQREFENLTLAEMLGLMRRKPLTTLRAVRGVALQKRAGSASSSRTLTIGGLPASTATSGPQRSSTTRPDFYLDSRTLLALGLLLAAIALAWWGNRAVTAGAVSSFGLADTSVDAGLLFWISALVLAVLAQLIGGIRSKQPTLAGEAQTEVEPLRLRLLPVVILLTAGAYFFNGDNRFSLPGVVAWIGSIIAVIVLFAPRFDLFAALSRTWRTVTGFPRRETGTFVLLLLIIGLGAFVRLQYLDISPPEMTSDHVEKLLDAQQVAQGEYRVFMEQNGGRESAQFYLLALLDKLPGITLDFMALKILAVLEALITIPIFWWLGREWIGPRDQRLGNLFGLTLALVLALAYWHQELSRIALRIVLTPLVGSLLLIYLVRMMRFNHRADYIKAGMVLGFGLYTYQAVRMMPLLVIAAVAIAVLFNVRHWRTMRSYALNFVVLVAVSFVIFMPLFRYSVQYPQFFWSRTSGRLLGPEQIERINEVGQVVLETPTLNDRLTAMSENLSQLAENMVNALLMFNYRGDVIYLHNVPDYPHLDPLLGALLIVGVGGWLVWMVRRRDPADWLLLPGILILLLPTALSIALPRENPSATRASGALPLVMILVAFGAVTLLLVVHRLIPNRRVLLRQAVTGVMALLLIVGAYGYTSWVFAEPYREIYFQSWHPISTGGRIMRGFAESGGAYGNAFILRFDFWWDYRAVAIEAGLPPGTWTNGDMPVDQVPKRMADSWTGQNVYPLRADRDLLFFYHRDDAAAEEQFRQWFPQGYSTYVEVTLPPVDPADGEGNPYPDKDFKYYRVPALGENALTEFLLTYNVEG